MHSFIIINFLYVMNLYGSFFGLIINSGGGKDLNLGFSNNATKTQGSGNLYVYFFKIYIKKWFVILHTSSDLAALATIKRKPPRQTSKFNNTRNKKI